LPSPSRFRLFYLLHLSRPALDRPVYRLLCDRPVRSIVELGIGTGERAQRMIEVTALHGPVGQVRYTGVDLFEARSRADGPGLSLKEAHRLLKATGVRVQLLPGDPFTALSRAPSNLVGTDLVVISPHHDAKSLERAWYYLPRMLGPNSRVLVQESGDGQGSVRLLTAKEIEKLAGFSLRRYAA